MIISKSILRGAQPLKSRGDCFDQHDRLRESTSAWLGWTTIITACSLVVVAQTLEEKSTPAYSGKTVYCTSADQLR